MNKYEQYWDGGPSGWTIAESENYILRGEYEGAELIQKSDGKRITSVGDFYGEPIAGIIDKNEKYCVTVGCGVIVYKLIEPFEEYMYNRNTKQWFEFGRGPENIEWTNSVKQVSDNEIELTDADGETKIIRIDM